MPFGDIFDFDLVLQEKNSYLVFTSYSPLTLTIDIHFLHIFVTSLSLHRYRFEKYVLASQQGKNVLKSLDTFVWHPKSLLVQHITSREIQKCHSLDKVCEHMMSANPLKVSSDPNLRRLVSSKIESMIRLRDWWLQITLCVYLDGLTLLLFWRCNLVKIVFESQTSCQYLFQSITPITFLCDEK